MERSSAHDLSVAHHIAVHLRELENRLKTL
jgi:hypothetical protein